MLYNETCQDCVDVVKTQVLFYKCEFFFFTQEHTTSRNQWPTLCFHWYWAGLSFTSVKMDWYLVINLWTTEVDCCLNGAGAHCAARVFYLVFIMFTLFHKPTALELWVWITHPVNRLLTQITAHVWLSVSSECELGQQNALCMCLKFTNWAQLCSKKMILTKTTKSKVGFYVWLLWSLRCARVQWNHF